MLAFYILWTRITAAVVAAAAATTTTNTTVLVVVAVTAVSTCPLQCNKLIVAIIENQLTVSASTNIH